jgi:hypothetical protein
VYGLFQDFGGPLIQTFSSGLRGHQCLAMYFWGHAKQKLSRRRFLGFDSAFFAVSQTVIHRHFELRSKLGHGFAMKTNDRANAQNSSHENIVSFVELDTGAVALMGHRIHGPTPIRSNSFSGCRDAQAQVHAMRCTPWRVGKPTLAGSDDHRSRLLRFRLT